MPNVSWLTTLTILSINSWNSCTYFVYFKSKKELNYDRFVDLNILGAARLVHSDLRIYRISFFLLDILIKVSVLAASQVYTGCRHTFACGKAMLQNSKGNLGYGEVTESH